MHKTFYVNYQLRRWLKKKSNILPKSSIAKKSKSPAKNQFVKAVGTHPLISKNIWPSTLFYSTVTVYSNPMAAGSLSSQANPKLVLQEEGKGTGKGNSQIPPPTKIPLLRQDDATARIASSGTNKNLKLSQ